ncbi:hypothetical protein [Falsirhodobacter sp. 20TX0035]|uniref:hypothetical protein n=1 Tax=Falsirhodobacter sp. 20TX0035 TaxID=3022019 RepID=UPI00232D39B7|nr:hypothetical protein [Falsirhodobacter sp. 20TX0035]MDB6452596.1 hypothetical protein [Falsirhodobacter sp. 20TX0035]
MFSDTGRAANRVVLASFKVVLKDPGWSLILSSIPDLAKHIENDETSEERRQLRYLLGLAHFGLIHPARDFGKLNT